MGRKYCGKRRNCSYEQFLLFPQCFQKACFPEVSKGVIVWEWVNFPLSRTRNFFEKNVGTGKNAKCQHFLIFSHNAFNPCQDKFSFFLYTVICKYTGLKFCRLVTEEVSKPGFGVGGKLNAVAKRFRHGSKLLFIDQSTK